METAHATRNPGGAINTMGTAGAASHLPDMWAHEPAQSLAMHDETASHLAELFWQIDGIGNHGDAGYMRFAWSDEEALLRVWFAMQLQRRGFRVEVDPAGNQWAWLGDGDAVSPAPAVTIGSHLDSVPGGGAFDGPLGVLSAIAAFDELRERGWKPDCPLGIVNFHDEEGARFAVACFGSRVLTGVLSGDDALRRTDANGVSVQDAMAEFASRLDRVRRALLDDVLISDADAAADVDVLPGADRLRSLARAIASERNLPVEQIVDDAINASYAPDSQHADPELLDRIAAHIELHVEQGCAQRDLDAPVAVADMIWPHGRWRVDFAGEANHAGTTPVNRRHDPLLAFARFTQCVRQEAESKRDARATVGRVEVEPNGVNVVASHVACWLDCRASRATTVTDIVRALDGWLANADLEGVRPALTRESWTEPTVFSDGLRDQLVCSAGLAAVRTPGGFAAESDRVDDAGGVNGTGADASTPAIVASMQAGAVASGPRIPVIGTAAGHDAGILAETGHAAGMLFVRNETGASHTPREFATLADCVEGVHAYAAAVRDCVRRVGGGWRPKA